MNYHKLSSLNNTHFSTLSGTYKVINKYRQLLFLLLLKVYLDLGTEKEVKIDLSSHGA